MFAFPNKNNIILWVLLHLWSLWTVKLLPHQNPKVSERKKCSKDVTCAVLQGSTDQQRIIQDWVVENAYYLHVL